MGARAVRWRANQDRAALCDGSQEVQPREAGSRERPHEEHGVEIPSLATWNRFQVLLEGLPRSWNRFQVEAHGTHRITGIDSTSARGFVQSIPGSG